MEAEKLEAKIIEVIKPYRGKRLTRGAVREMETMLSYQLQEIGADYKTASIAAKAALFEVLMDNISFLKE